MAGNGLTPAEWRRFVLDELRAIRAEAKGDREAFRRWVDDEFVPVRDYVTRQRGQVSLVDKVRQWGALIVAIAAIVVAMR